MASLANQNISTSYPQVLKTFGANIVGTAMAAISSGDEAGVSALQISTTGAKSTGTFAVDGATTFGSSITASTGTATIGTLFASGPATFGSSITASTGTATIGTIVATSETVTNSTVSNRITTGTIRIGASGPSIIQAAYGTASFPSTVVGPYNASGTSTGTFAVTGALPGDFVCGSINSIGSATGAAGFYAVPSFYVISADTVRWAIAGPASQGTIGAGIVGATTWRTTA